jgi:hypothetical protein
MSQRGIAGPESVAVVRGRLDHSWRMNPAKRGLSVCRMESSFTTPSQYFLDFFKNNPSCIQFQSILLSFLLVVYPIRSGENGEQPDDKDNPFLDMNSVKNFMYIISPSLTCLHSFIYCVCSGDDHSSDGVSIVNNPVMRIEWQNLLLQLFYKTLPRLRYVLVLPPCPLFLVLITCHQATVKFYLS